MRQLQLKRFDIIFKNRDTALANLKKYENTYADGEIMAAAFYDDKTTDNGKKDIAYIVGIYVKKGDETKLFTIDVKDIENQIEEVKNFIENTLKYASGVELVSAATYNSGTTDTYKVDMANTDDDKFFRLFFTPVSNDTEKVSVSIGDIKAGTEASELKKYTLSRLIDAMLFKTIYPTILNEPYATISRPTSSSEVEVGTTISNADSFHLTYGKGQAQVKMEKQNLSATADTGNEISNSIKYSFNGGTSTDFGSSLTLSGLGTYTFTGIVNYAKGDILCDSKGNSGDTKGIEAFASTAATSTTLRENPHPAGSVSATTSVSTYYKPGANNNNIDIIAKLDAKATKNMTIDFKTKESVNDNGKVVEGGGYKIAVPNAIWNGNMNSVKVMKYNAGANAFNGDDTANWEVDQNLSKLKDANNTDYECYLLKHKAKSIGNDGTGNARVAFQINIKM